MASSTRTSQQRCNLRRPEVTQDNGNGGRQGQSRSRHPDKPNNIATSRQRARFADKRGSPSAVRRQARFADLARSEDGRNVDAFVVAINRHLPRSVSDQRGARFALAL